MEILLTFIGNLKWIYLPGTRLAKVVFFKKKKNAGT